MVRAPPTIPSSTTRATHPARTDRSRAAWFAPYGSTCPNLLGKLGRGVEKRGESSTSGSRPALSSLAQYRAVSRSWTNRTSPPSSVMTPPRPSAITSGYTTTPPGGTDTTGAGSTPDANNTRAAVTLVRQSGPPSRVVAANANSNVSTGDPAPATGPEVAASRKPSTSRSHTRIVRSERPTARPASR